MTPEDIDSFFPDEISDEAAYVLCEFIAKLSVALEHRHYGQLRRYVKESHPARDAEQPWKTKIK